VPEPTTAVGPGTSQEHPDADRPTTQSYPAPRYVRPEDEPHFPCPLCGSQAWAEAYLAEWADPDLDIDPEAWVLACLGCGVVARELEFAEWA
jgi:hypothetical protein